MRTHTLGIFQEAPLGGSEITKALEQDGRINLVRVAPGSELSNDLSGIVVDVPLHQRFEVLSSIGETCELPILTQMPVGDSSQKCLVLNERFGNERILSLNPLAHVTPIQSMIDQVLHGKDSLQTLFATWRFASGSTWEQEFLQLLSIVSTLTESLPARSSALFRTNPELLLAILTFENSSLASLEIGEHLPEATSRNTELLIECFTREHAYQCRPFEQAITIEGVPTSYLPWSPNPWQQMVSTFLKMIEGSQRASRGSLDDATLLEIREWIQSSVDGPTISPATSRSSHSSGRTFS